MNHHVVSSFSTAIMSQLSIAGTTVSARCSNTAHCATNVTDSLATLYTAR